MRRENLRWCVGAVLLLFKQKGGRVQQRPPIPVETCSVMHLRKKPTSMSPRPLSRLSLGAETKG